MIAKNDERASDQECQDNAFNFKDWAIALSRYVSINSRMKKFQKILAFACLS